METDINNGYDSNEKCHKHLWNILADRSINIDKKFILKLPKESTNVNKEVKNTCKVLQFSSEWNFDEVLAIINELDPKDYPQLFIFIIEDSNFDFLESEAATCEPPKKKLKFSIEKLRISLLKFGSQRPLIVQLTSNDHHNTEIYYKDKKNAEFTLIDQTQEGYTKITNFSTFLQSFLYGRFDNFEVKNEFFQKVEDSTLILKFLRTLKLKDEILATIILEISKSCSKHQFLAILDAPFEDEDCMLSQDNQGFISCTFKQKSDGESSTDSSPSIDSQNSTAENFEKFFKNSSDNSVLLTAVEHKNKEVIDYLIYFWSHLIQHLRFDHQVRISTCAFDTGQLDVLINLINVADFPFPMNLNLNDNLDQRLRELILERKEFHAAIDEENYPKLDAFITQHLNLKLVYNLDNKSAINHAVNFKKFKSYFYLASAGFSLTDEIDCKEVEIMKKEIKKLKDENIKSALMDENRSIKMLCTRSFIHNRRISKDQEVQYRSKIQEWFEEIKRVKFGAELLRVAASCEKLKVIFNFESFTVYPIDLHSNAHGLTKTIEIFIGAKFVNKNREQFIKGVLAHELCHYALNLIYRNSFLPYYKHATKVRDQFDEIVKYCKLLLEENNDDECCGIISHVYTSYSSSKLNCELIVRVMQILTQFWDDEDKIRYLQTKYEKLFNFWEYQVVPDLESFNLDHRKEIEHFNKYVGFLPSLSSIQKIIKFVNLEKVSTIFNNQFLIITTNVPKLLFISIYESALEKYDKLTSATNIFITPKQLYEENGEHCWKEFKEICNNNSKLNIFVDCSKGFKDCIEKIIVNKNLNFTFVLSKLEEVERLEGFIKEKVDKMEVNFIWSDLTEESQKSLLKTEVTFQNTSKCTLESLLECKPIPEEPSTSNSIHNLEDKNLSDVIDPQLLQMLVEKSEIIVNSSAIEVDKTEKSFEILFQPRRFIKIENNPKIPYIKSGKTNKTMNLDQLLLITKKMRYILISDMAGNGKSWVMKNIAKVLRERNPKCWVSYVDLKLYIEEFKALDMEPDFSTFMAEKILKPQKQFEAKIFQKLYKDGRVFILFDGFDEIAPKYAEVVRELIRTLEPNDSNQIWIATRDYFEVDLKKRLHIDIACKLEEFTEQDGINFIAKSWMLMDMNVDNIKSKDDFENFIKSSPKYSNYKEKAEKIVKQALMTDNLSVGLPQLFKMIADTNSKEILKLSKMYESILDKLYKRWAEEKGELRNEANVESQKYDQNFRKFHQFAAISSLFPDYIVIFFGEYDGKEWQDEEVIACGIMSIKDGKFYFLHETFREYLAAEAIVIKLRMKSPNKAVIELFVDILTIEKYGIIRMFLNDLLDKTTLGKISPKVQEFKSKFYEMNSFHDIFTKGLNNLGDFVMTILKSGEKDKVGKILNENSWIIVTKTKDLNLLEKFLNFVYEKLENLTALIKEQRIFLGLAGSTFTIECFDKFLKKIEGKVGQDFVTKGLQLETTDGNIFYYLCQSINLNAEKVQKFIKILQIYISDVELLKLMENCTKNKENVLQIYIQSGMNSNFKAVWNEFKNFCESQSYNRCFKDLIMQKDIENKSILHHIANCTQIDPNVNFWDILFKSIDNENELHQFILETDRKGNNFIHELVNNDKNFQFIELTFNFFKDYFNDAQYHEIMISTNYKGHNVLKSVASSNQNIQVYHLLWDIFENLNFFKEVDANLRDILTIIVKHSSSEILNYTFNKIENFSKEDIKILLSYIGTSTHNYLQLAAIHNESLEFHQSIWDIFKKYFTQSEILKFIYHKDKSSDNLLFVAIMKNSVEVVEFIWNQIKDVMNPNDFNDYMLLKRSNGDNLTEMAYDNFDHQRKIFSWVQSYVRKLGVKIKFERIDRMAAFAQKKNKLTGNK